MADPVASVAALLPRTQTPPAPAPPRPLGPSSGSGVVPLPIPSKTPPLTGTDKQATIDKFLHPDKQAAGTPPAKNKTSIAGQIGGIFKGLVPGLVHAGEQAAVDAAGFVRVPIESFQHRGESHIAIGPDGKPQFVGGPHITAEKYFPLLSGTGHSMEDTAGRLAQLGPVEVRSVGHRPVHTYGDVARNGQIVPTLLGDAFNVSLAAGVAGKALGAASGAADTAGLTRTASGLGQASDVANTVSRYGGRAANAPIEAVGGVLKGGRSIWRDAGQAAAEKARGLLPDEGPLSMPLQSTVEGRVSKAAARQAMNEPGAASRFLEKNLARDAGLVEKDPAMRPSMAEQEVGLTLASNVAQADKLLRDKMDPTLTPDVAREMTLGAHVKREEPGLTMTREGQALAHQYLDGTLPPEQMARIDRVTQAYKKQEAPITENALQGTGLIKGPMDPAFTGDAPIERQVDLQLEAAGVDPHQIDAMHQAMAQGATWDDMKQVVPELAPILLKPDVYPKPWRESMNVMAKGRDKLGLVDLPHTPDEMLAAGFDRPSYMPTTTSNIGKERAPATAPITSGMSTGLRGIANERHSATQGYGPYSIATAAEALGKNVRNTKFNSIVQNYVSDARLPSAGDVLARSGIDVNALRADAEQYVNATEVGGLNKADHEKAVSEELGRQISQHLQENGYQVLPGNRADPQPGDFNPSTAARADQINGDSVVLPAGVKDSMVQYKVGKDRNRALALNRGFNMSLKRNLLAFNAHWMIGDAIRNSLMAWVSGGVDPMTLAKSMIDVKQLAPQIQDEIFNRAAFTHQGMRAQDASLNPDGSIAQRGPTKVGGFVADHTGLPGQALGKAGEGIRAFQSAHFKLNSTLNKTQRMGWSFAKLERELQHRGLSSTDAMGTNLSKWQDPPVQKAINDVINESNRLFGSMDELSPMERRVMTQVYPFWGWMRHVTTIAARTAVDNPARMLWTLRLGAVGMNTSPQDMPDFLRGSIGAGKNKRVSASWLNPFYDMGTGGLLDPSTSMKSMSPLIKATVTAATNRDLNRNLNTVSHAPGTHPNSFASAAFQAATSVPWTRAAVNEAPSVNVPGVGWGLGPVKRYGSGQPLFATPGDARPISSGSRLHGLAGAVSIPLPTAYTPKADKVVTTRRKTSTGLKRTGLGSGGLKRTALGSG